MEKMIAILNQPLSKPGDSITGNDPRLVIKVARWGVFFLAIALGVVLNYFSFTYFTQS